MRRHRFLFFCCTIMLVSHFVSAETASPPPFTVPKSVATYDFPGAVHLNDMALDATRGRIYLSDSHTSAVYRWDIDNATPLPPISTGHPSSHLDVAQGDSRLLVCPTDLGAILDIDLATEAISPIPTPGSETPYSIAAGNAFAIFSNTIDSKRQCVLNLSTGVIQEQVGLADATYGTSLNHQIAIAACGYFIGFFDLNTGQIAKTVGSPWPVLYYPEPASNWNASMAAAPMLEFFTTYNTWVVSSSNQDFQFTTVSERTPNTFTWSGRYLLNGSSIYDTSTWGLPVASVPLETLSQALFSPDGTKLFGLRGKGLTIVTFGDQPSSISGPAIVDVNPDQKTRIPLAVTDPDASPIAMTGFDLPEPHHFDIFTTGSELVIEPTLYHSESTFNATVFAATPISPVNSLPHRMNIKVRRSSYSDVAVTLNASMNPAFVNQPFTYTVNVANNGSVAATGVTVTDQLPAGVKVLSSNSEQGTIDLSGNTAIWSVGEVPPGAGYSAEFRVVSRTEGQISNTASVTSAEPDPIDDNNAAILNTEVVNESDLTIDWSTARLATVRTRRGPLQFVAGLVKARNLGSVFVRDVQLRIYVSDDTQVDSTDTILSTRTIGYLRPASEFRKWSYVRVPSGLDVAGKYLIAVVDPEGTVPELLETNNAAVFGPM